MELIKDKGICIRSTDYSESSQILTFFTYAGGKVSVIAKGTRRTTKTSFSGAIEICSAGDMVYSIRDGDKLGTLTEFNPTFFSTGIRKKLLALNCSFFAAELLNLFTREHDPHPELFEEAMTFLKKLDENPDSKVPMFLMAFQFDLLTYTGSMPTTDMCVNCKRKFNTGSKQYYFSVAGGGFVCRDCESAFADKKLITLETAVCLNNPEKCADVKPAALIQAEELMIEYITYVLEKRPRTVQMILQLIRTIK
ncbi:MAG: DNA repair protein RecO [Planctomycetaceae bacterium]|nr:DNA repair protein RecO [Planctomycetaceae bacterium]